MTTEPVIPAREHVLAVDLGSQIDFTAVAAMSKVTEGTGEWTISPGKERREKARTRYELHRLVRLPLRTPYTVQVPRIAEMYARLQEVTGRCPLVMDVTGVGRPILHMFQAAGLQPTAITLTGGNEIAEHGLEISLPKRVAIQFLDAIVHSGELKVAETGAEEERLLRAELRDFRPAYTPVGLLTFSARSGAHDDLLLACALGGWFLGGRPKREMWIHKLIG